MRPVPVFMYHHVNPNRGDMVTVTPEVFEGQMRHLNDAGYRTLKISQLIEIVRGERKPKERGVVITFDDGFLDNYIYAYPILKEYNIHAAVFVTTGWVRTADAGSVRLNREGLTHRECMNRLAGGRGNGVIMDWSILKEMNGSGLIEVYSHTVTHRRCAGLREEEVLREIETSKKEIEGQIGEECPYLSWPKGTYDDASVKVARDAGYRALFTTERGVVRFGADPYALKRIVVKNSVRWFEKRARIYTGNLTSRIYLLLRGER